MWVWLFREFCSFEGAGYLRGVKGELLLDAAYFPCACGRVQAIAVGDEWVEGCALGVEKTCASTDTVGVPAGRFLRRSGEVQPIIN